MSLDRALQHQILRRLELEYPASVSAPHWVIGTETEAAENVVLKNIYYLADHGLINVVFSKELGQKIQRPAEARITHHGLDFLADDGGLSAILGVVTVKIHEDTLRQLIATKIQDFDLPAEEKSSLLQTVKELPGEAIKHLSEKLLDLGLENAPRAVSLIHKALQYVQS
ncbi:hypothetical protein [Pseudomonas sp. R16(2017)]|uniref:hypothetical protein n=1 Tax=Pseudomonas sp. R16(2017) TaxID=1981704 RepID=UPI000A1F83CF|nr:hypothetical protein [Pseudomonas sp. R16(2017)]